MINWGPHSSKSSSTEAVVAVAVAAIVILSSPIHAKLVKYFCWIIQLRIGSLRSFKQIRFLCNNHFSFMFFQNVTTVMSNTNFPPTRLKLQPLRTADTRYNVHIDLAFATNYSILHYIHSIHMMKTRPSRQQTQPTTVDRPRMDERRRETPHHKSVSETFRSDTRSAWTGLPSVSNTTHSLTKNLLDWHLNFDVLKLLCSAKTGVLF